MSFDCGNRLVVALDVEEGATAERLVEQLSGSAAFIKVGLELFVAEGPALVRSFVARGHRVMLDLKLHDIPTTVGRAVARLGDLGVELVTVHASGGRAMLQAAVQAAQAAGARRPRILAVTVLTSLSGSELAEVAVSEEIQDLVPRLAHLARSSGADGVVCSPHEAARLRRDHGPDFLIVTPGVRPAGAALGDQKRVMTAAEARAAGADLVVVGRPIRDASDPAAAARTLALELEGLR